MPRIIDYSIVEKRMREAHFVSLYHNSGAFGFAPGQNVEMLGWIGADDSTIRAEMRPFTRNVPPPLEQNLACMLEEAAKLLSGDAWLMPKSHWHFELHDGHPHVLPELLTEIDIDADQLRDRNDGAAIAFARDEVDTLARFMERLLARMVQSDFLIAWPDERVLCTVHHHKQLWWEAIKLPHV